MCGPREAVLDDAQAWTQGLAKYPRALAWEVEPCMDLSAFLSLEARPHCLSLPGRVSTLLFTHRTIRVTTLLCAWMTGLSVTYSSMCPKQKPGTQ